MRPLKLVCSGIMLGSCGLVSLWATSAFADTLHATSTVPSAGDALGTLLLGGLMGLLGQGIRTVAGFRAALDAANATEADEKDVFRAARILISLFIGFLAGIAATLVVGIDDLSGHTTDVHFLLGIAAAGYAGTDFLEAFFGQYLKGVSPPSLSGPAAAPSALASSSKDEQPGSGTAVASLELTDVRQSVAAVHSLLLASPALQTAGSPQAVFAGKAPGVAHKLMSDFDLKDFQACGVLGNIGVECLGFTQLQEMDPIGGGRGGYGWCQWTGPRRRDFEAFCAASGLREESDDANYGYLARDLKGSFRSTVVALKASQTLENAVLAFLENYEKPKVPAAGRRVSWASLALKALNGAQGSGP